MTTKPKKNAKKYLEKKFGAMTLGFFLRSLREADDISLTEFAAKLGLSRANLCDIEKGRKIPTPERASRMAHSLEIPEKVLIQLALQDALREANLDYDVELKKAS